MAVPEFIPDEPRRRSTPIRATRPWISCFGFGCAGAAIVSVLVGIFAFRNWDEITEAAEKAEKDRIRRMAEPRTDEEIEIELRKGLVGRGEKEILEYEAIPGTATVRLSWREGLAAWSGGDWYIVSLPGRASGRFVTDDENGRDCRVAYAVAIHQDATRSEPLVDTVTLRYMHIGGKTVFETQSGLDAPASQPRSASHQRATGIETRPAKTRTEKLKEMADRAFQSREFRLWTSGDHTVRAKLKSLGGAKATLVREDNGKVVVIAVDILSDDDQEYIDGEISKVHR